MYKSVIITPGDVVRTFFTADTHFGHGNAVGFDKRPFASVGEHDLVVTRRFRDAMPPGSTLYHLGDLAWSHDEAAEFMVAMKDHGVRVVWICGNHDSRSGMSQLLPQNLWLSLKEVPEAGVPGVWLSHYPHLAWPNSFHGSIHLFGHVHGKCGSMPPYGRLLDVGLMNWGYKPVSLVTVLELMKGREAAPV